MAGVIAAKAFEDTGVEGVAPQSELVTVKSCVSHTTMGLLARCWSSTLARGIDAASQRDVQVMNLSVGGPEDRLLAKAVGAAREAGIAVVSAAGNDGPSGKPKLSSGVRGRDCRDGGGRREPDLSARDSRRLRGPSRARCGHSQHRPRGTDPAFLRDLRRHCVCDGCGGAASRRG